MALTHSWPERGGNSLMPQKSSSVWGRAKEFMGPFSGKIPKCLKYRSGQDLRFSVWDGGGGGGLIGQLEG